MALAMRCVIGGCVWALVAALWIGSAGADPAAGKGHGGQGKGGHGKGGHGKGLPVEARDTIHELFSSHRAIEREVTRTETGYRATTVSSDPEIARLLQEHVKQMSERLGSGRAVRRWDPAFAEMVEYYDELKVTIRNIPGGVSVEVAGKTPEAVAVARNHAKIVSSFVKHGSSQARKTHPRALE